MQAKQLRRRATVKRQQRGQGTANPEEERRECTLEESALCGHMQNSTRFGGHLLPRLGSKL